MSLKQALELVDYGVTHKDLPTDAELVFRAFYLQHLNTLEILALFAQNRRGSYKTEAEICKLLHQTQAYIRRGM